MHRIYGTISNKSASFSISIPNFITIFESPKLISYPSSVVLPEDIPNGRMAAILLP